MNTEIDQRIADVLGQMGEAAQRSGRNSDEVALVSVSKTHSASLMNDAAQSLMARARPVIFGESYVREFEEKKNELTTHYTSRLIGHLQSNKVAKAIELFDLIESVHSEKLLRLINAEAQKRSRNFPILLQINISHDQKKSGFLPGEVDRLFAEVLPACANLSVRGLMTITELFKNPADARPDFAALRVLGEQLSQRFGGTAQVQKKLDLSMGMSADYQIAIEEGATSVRVGSAIFGNR